MAEHLLAGVSLPSQTGDLGADLRAIATPPASVPCCTPKSHTSY